MPLAVYNARLRELDRLIAEQDPLAGRVLDNEEERARRQRKRYRPRIFKADPIRHPLDRRFQCGFDPLNVPIKAYTAHIRACPDKECQGRRQRWFDLGEYFKRRA